MAITFPLSLPTSKSPSRVTWSAGVAATSAISDFTSSEQVQSYSGQFWAIDVTLPTMERSDAEEWISFLLKLNGAQGTFFFHDATSQSPRGVATGNPRVQGAGQQGQELITYGWTASATGIMLAGDFIQLGTRLHKVLQDTNSNSSGVAKLDIWPRLRESPANAATIITTNCKGLFRLTSSQFPIGSRWGTTEQPLYDISFSAVEDIS